MVHLSKPRWVFLIKRSVDGKTFRGDLQKIF